MERRESKELLKLQHSRILLTMQVQIAVLIALLAFFSLVMKDIGWALATLLISLLFAVLIFRGSTQKLLDIEEKLGSAEKMSEWDFKRKIYLILMVVAAFILIYLLGHLFDAILHVA